MLRLIARRALSTAAPRRVRTAPHARVTVRGGAHGGDVAFSTNMESDVATISATACGVALDTATALSVAHDGADFEVLAEGNAGVSLAISVPSSFTVVACRAGRPSNVRVDGWIEGGVELTTERGDVSVRTVRGMLTTLATGEGHVCAEMIEGDARMSTGRGSVSIGKLQGKVLHASSAHGDVTARAIYCHDARLSARAGSVKLGFLHTERATIEVAAGEVRIDALDGGACVRATDGGRIRVQLSDGARELELHADGDVEVLVPEHLAFRAEANGIGVHCDPALQGLVTHDAQSGDTRTVRLARAPPAGGAPADGLPAGSPVVRATSTAGTVRFLAHSWLDRFKTAQPGGTAPA
ncbi:hypothetical protein KFE25_005376 [Diacronema lutheri]|uniref:DUF4097 domain-containing protein n=2 Tax=Diacronema lutheri TaxID=2081491 RepID=A0A8J5XBV0_DIALT|nr:hypothetical protein KFE25_005376 [Diacronema lutheri]